MQSLEAFSAVSCVDILGVRTNASSFEEAIQTHLRWAKDERRRYVSTATAYTLVMAAQNPPIMTALNAADSVTADGMPIVWLQRRSGERHAERVYGPDLMRAVCRESAQHGIQHFFYGGLPGIPEKLAERLQACYPDLRVAGTHSPAGDVLHAMPQATTVALLNTAKPDIIWVGLGSPKQDLWMHAYRDHLNAPLLIGVGAAFDFLSGTKPQAPKWMQRSGFEWFYRLLTEPRRLGKRYIVYNARFVYLLMRASLSGSASKPYP